MIIATITDHKTDEDSEYAANAARQLIDAFIRRPSLEDQAMHGMADVVNQKLYVTQQENRREYVTCAFAVLFVLRHQARWITGGGSVIYHFVDGQLMKCSKCMDAPALGLHNTYALELEDTFNLAAGQNSFFLCSAELAKHITPELLRTALDDCADAEQWLQRVVEQVGSSRQYCASALILPQRKRLFGGTKPAPRR